MNSYIGKFSLELKKCVFSIEDFRKAPKQEQAFFIRILNVFTEINILQKCIVLSSQKATDPMVDSLEKNAKLIQALFFLRLLAGVLSEAHNLIAVCYFARAGGEGQTIKKLRLIDISPAYQSGMDDGGLESLRHIEEYFSSGNNYVKLIRDKFAFHFDFDHIFENLDAILSISEPELFFSEQLGNCHFPFSDQALMFSLIGKMGFAHDEKGLENAVLKIGEDLGNLTSDVLNYFSAFIYCFSNKYLKINLSQMLDFQVKGISKVGQLEIPFFIKFD